MPLMVEGFKLLALVAEASWRQHELDKMRESRSCNAQ